ncbi:olfactory receptor 5V1-like [Hyperolius riggenbachi]|uniref:olfactory receptor 5V1-like n=1 Tax=Hyperolius riggenbachi TaxID=752182 RepID=UPI0035A311D4
MTITGNVLVILLITLDHQLHTPMYFFLLNLALIEILYTTDIIPNTLKNLLNENKVISFVGCFTQMFLFVTLGGSECILLGIMAYDRYVAICHPLLYTVIMKKSFCLCLALVCWAIGFFDSVIHTVLTATLPYCQQRLVRHYFCDIPPLLKISCKDTYINELVVFLVGGSVIVGSLLLTLISYIFVIGEIYRIPSTSGKKKAFSTCTSHLTVVSIFFGTVILTYLRPASQSYNYDQIMSLVYVVVTPLINPLIYSFRNKDVQKALKKVLKDRLVV